MAPVVIPLLVCPRTKLLLPWQVWAAERDIPAGQPAVLLVEGLHLLPPLHPGLNNPPNGPPAPAGYCQQGCPLLGCQGRPLAARLAPLLLCAPQPQRTLISKQRALCVGAGPWQPAVLPLEGCNLLARLLPGIPGRLLFWWLLCSLNCLRHHGLLRAATSTGRCQGRPESTPVCLPVVW